MKSSSEKIIEFSQRSRVTEQSTKEHSSLGSNLPIFTEIQIHKIGKSQTSDLPIEVNSKWRNFDKQWNALLNKKAYSPRVSQQTDVNLNGNQLKEFEPQGDLTVSDQIEKQQKERHYDINFQTAEAPMRCTPLQNPLKCKPSVEDQSPIDKVKTF